MHLPFLLLTAVTAVLGIYDPNHFWWLGDTTQMNPDTYGILAMDVERAMKEYLENQECDCCAGSGWSVGSGELGFSDWPPYCPQWHGSGSGSGDDGESGSGYEYPSCKPSEPSFSQKFTAEYLRVLKLMTERAMATRLQNRDCCNVPPTVPNCTEYYCEYEEGSSHYLDEWPTVFFPTVPPSLLPKIVRFMKKMVDDTVHWRLNQCFGCFTGSEPGCLVEPENENCIYNPQKFLWARWESDHPKSAAFVLSKDVKKFLKKFFDQNECDCCARSEWDYGSGSGEVEDWSPCADESGEESGSGSGESHVYGGVWYAMEFCQHRTYHLKIAVWFYKQFTNEYLRVLESLTYQGASKRFSERTCCETQPSEYECSGEGSYFCEEHSGSGLDPMTWPTVFFPGCEGSSDTGCGQPLLTDRMVRYMKNLTEQTVQTHFERNGCECTGSGSGSSEELN